jgi:hypothetical protein
MPGSSRSQTPPEAAGRVFTAAGLPQLAPVRVATQAAGAKSPAWPPLAVDKARYVGEAVNPAAVCEEPRTLAVYGTPKPEQMLRGTEGSNPVPSSGESIANLTIGANPIHRRRGSAWCLGWSRPSRVHLRCVSSGPEVREHVEMPG